MTIPSPRARKRARLEIIPLIDIVFFLLATFVMVSLSMVKNKGIPVNLPTATQTVTRDSQEQTALTVTASGELFFNREKTTLAELPTQLDALKKSTLTPRIVLHGDTKAPWGDAVSVLDTVRKAGIGNVSIETKGSP